MKIIIIILMSLNICFAQDLILNRTQCVQLYNYQRFIEYARDNNINKKLILDKIKSDSEITNKQFLINETNFIYNLPNNFKYSKETLKQCDKGGLILRSI